MSGSAPSEKIVLLVKAPKVVSNSVSKFESLFGDLHKFFEDQQGLSTIEKTISLEVELKENYFHYRLILSPKIAQVVKSLIYSQFQEVEIIDQDSAEMTEGRRIVAEFTLKRSNLFPLKTDFSSEDDPYITISAVLSKFEHFNEGAILQLLIIPGSES